MDIDGVPFRVIEGSDGFRMEAQIGGHWLHLRSKDDQIRIPAQWAGSVGQMLIDIAADNDGMDGLATKPEAD